MSQPKPDFSQLSISERIQLVEDIWDSIVAENPAAVQLSDGQRQEIRRRLEDHDAEPSSAIPWEQVRSELFQRNH
ncbi:MAG TPA: addiction module protein [Xanthomonadaceae bacterium]|nr:addiction module protein [Xanthomonadaceae bacterium]